MARIYTKTNRKKGRRCGRCGKEIPTGDRYLITFPGYRNKTGTTRCTSCGMRFSDTMSGNMAEAYAALEDAEETIGEAESPEDVQQALSDASDALRDVASLYDDANSNWAGGQAENPEFVEKRDELESAADELSDFYPNEYEEDEELDEDEQAEAKNAHLEDVRDEARGLIEGISLP